MEIVIIVFLVLYLLVVLVVGRALIFNDVFPRIRPNGVSDLKGYNYTCIDFQGYDGTRLKGWFIRSKNNISGKTVLLLHGWRRGRSRYIDQINFFVDSGFHVLTYDQRGHGESQTKMITFGPDEAKDIFEAIKYAKSSCEGFNEELLVAVGFSLGASACVYAARAQIFKVIILEGIFASSFDVGYEVLFRKFGKLMANIVGYGIFNFGAAIWSFGKFHHAHPADVIGDVSPTPTMIIRGESDEKVTSKSIQKLLNAIEEPYELWVHSSGHTRALNSHPYEYKKRVLSFIEKNLTG